MRICVLAILLLSSHVQAETLIVTNVRGYALANTSVQPFASMIVVDGKVQRLLAQGESLPKIPNASILNGDGRTLLPGLIDAHGHVLGLGERRLQVDLRGSKSVDDALNRVRNFARDNLKNGWILGRGWNQVLWSDRKFPTAQQLDVVIADRPALFTRIDGHAIWVNSVALKIAGVSRTTRDPSGGQILRDADGNPSGVLIDAATELVERHIPAATDEEIEVALHTGLRELATLGITGVHDAGIDARSHRAYQALGRGGQLPVRVYAMLADSKEAREIIRAGVRQSEFDDRLHMRAVKAWVDGALGSRGAALLQDYSDQVAHRGLTRYSDAELHALAELAAQHGWQLAIHAIGDAGNRSALDAFEGAMTAAQRKQLRPRIEHAQVIALQDIPRFAKLDVIASIQPTHATSDMNMAEDRIGPTRIQGAYAWRKLKNAGARLAGGSDFPVELANPFHGLYAAIARKDRSGNPQSGWFAQEKLTREEALRLFTADAAFAAHMEHRVGSLQPGQWADFVLIDRDYFSIDESDIDDIVVNSAYVAGKSVTSATTSGARERSRR